MKNFVKICLIICAALACIGGICMCAGAALGSGPREVLEMVNADQFHIGNWHIGKWNVFYDDDEQYDYDEQHDYDDEEMEVQKGMLSKQFLASDVESLDIDIKYGEVYLKTGEGDQIVIDIDAPTRNRYQCKFEDGTLELEDISSWKRWGFTGDLGKKVTVEISIPEGKVFDEVELNTNAGKVKISHNLTAKEISLELDAGELLAENITALDEISADIGAGRLDITQFTANTLEVDCGMGEALLSGSILFDADITCGMGQIDLTLLAAESAYDYEMRCGLGRISINGQEYTSLGSKKNIQNNSGKKIALDCGLGEINVTSKEE